MDFIFILKPTPSPSKEGNRLRTSYIDLLLKHPPSFLAQKKVKQEQAPLLGGAGGGFFKIPNEVKNMLTGSEAFHFFPLTFTYRSYPSKIALYKRSPCIW
jgi:hypothetical protein